MTTLKSPDELTQLSKYDFDLAVRDGRITDPVIETFGDGYGEPYNPNRKAFGTLDGKKVWAWVRGDKVNDPVPPQ